MRNIEAQTRIKKFGLFIRVDVLVSELNFGASSRWAKAGAALPDEEGETPATTPMSLGLQ